MTGESEKKVIDVVVALIHSMGRYLVSKRRNDVHLACMWEFPGGKPERGETDEQALMREVLEETGMQIRVCRLYHQVTHSYPERTVNLRFYLCEPQSESPEPQALEVVEVCWADPDQLSNFEFPEANRALVKMLADSVTSPESVSQ